MLPRIRLALAAMILATAAVAGPRPKASAGNEECPVEHTIDDIVAAVEKAASCDGAMEIFQACAYTASGDVPIGEAVVKKCEGDFSAKLSAAQRKAYQSETERCWQKYRRASGTMYRSFEAFCIAGVAQRYAWRFLETKAPKR